MIKELKEKGLSCAMIANKMGVTRQTVNLWFTNKRTPSGKTIERLAKAIAELTKKDFSPADAYTLVCTVRERFEKEKQLRG